MLSGAANNLVTVFDEMKKLGNDIPMSQDQERKE